ncbi:carnitine O-palmitoyltransferase 1, liver isoform-like isoform X1 [Tubulanus polymorphus]|uniref:carnitine O-palmitoyltransferase 1, liver isoform-like isoform X1 n=1 Tax=Tubulanus polymorphus TaxID=672921 RepID=UPI003DA44598
MAEAHSAVAFSFTVSPDGGVDVNVNHEAFRAVWESFVRANKIKFLRFKNRVHNGVYPASPTSLLITVSLVLALTLAQKDVSFGLTAWIQSLLNLTTELSSPTDSYVACVLSATVMWISGIILVRLWLIRLLSYHAWMYEPRGKLSLKTKMWLGIVKFLGGRKPLLYSWQGSLPRLPVPAIKDTMRRYLKSVQPLTNDEDYKRLSALADEFMNGVGNKLQRYLLLKSWLSPNYVSDWWEEYVYLRGRSPIMVNSNFYGIDTVFLVPSRVQAARAANMVIGLLSFRREIEQESLMPILLQKTVPLCSAQYERQFNTCRIPGQETDTLMHVQDSSHIAVYHKGRYFKVYIRHQNRLLFPCELEVTLQQILDDKSEPFAGEEHLAALTAGERTPWATARSEYFSKGVNKTSLDTIEKAAFVLTFDEEEYDYSNTNDPDHLSRLGRAMLHGKAYDRWFDKSFTLVVSKDGRFGFNAEHSWADAPIMAHAWEYAVVSDLVKFGYRENGHCNGDPQIQPPKPIRLQWDLPEECIGVIENSLAVATKLISDVDLYLLMHDSYGKGFMKLCKVSPDAYIQLALQLAYYRDAHKFCLTYEASMTRLFREGRTETVRSCTTESSAFARAMEDKTKTNKERLALLKEACEAHQHGYRNAMTGRGIDRHLFCLYVVSKYLGIESPFLKEVLSEPWRLSTSQTPLQQTGMLDLNKNPEYTAAGGGFGPVADDGYGVSYIISGEDCIFFHISCKNSCPQTSSKCFADRITKALADIRELVEDCKTNK